MKTKIGIVLGSAVGTALYGAMRHGLSGIDWPRVVFIAAFTFAALLLVPSRWLEKKRADS